MRRFILFTVILGMVLLIGCGIAGNTPSSVTQEDTALAAQTAAIMPQNGPSPALASLYSNAEVNDPAYWLTNAQAIQPAVRTTLLAAPTKSWSGWTKEDDGWYVVSATDGSMNLACKLYDDAGQPIAPSNAAAPRRIEFYGEGTIVVYSDQDRYSLNLRIGSRTEPFQVEQTAGGRNLRGLTTCILDEDAVVAGIPLGGALTATVRHGGEAAEQVFYQPHNRATPPTGDLTATLSVGGRQVGLTFRFDGTGQVELSTQNMSSFGANDQNTRIDYDTYATPASTTASVADLLLLPSGTHVPPVLQLAFQANSAELLADVFTRMSKPFGSVVQPTMRTDLLPQSMIAHLLAASLSGPWTDWALQSDNAYAATKEFSQDGFSGTIEMKVTFKNEAGSNISPSVALQSSKFTAAIAFTLNGTVSTSDSQAVIRLSSTNNELDVDENGYSLRGFTTLELISGHLRGVSLRGDQIRFTYSGTNGSFFFPKDQTKAMTGTIRCELYRSQRQMFRLTLTFADGQVRFAYFPYRPTGAPTALSLSTFKTQVGLN